MGRDGRVEEKLAEFVAAFNRREYRKALDPVEDLWLADRDDFFTGLIRVTVALHQLDSVGLTDSPRFLLATAARLLGPFAPTHRGVDVAGLLGFIARCRDLVEARAAAGAQGPAPPPAYALGFVPGSGESPGRPARAPWYRRLLRGPRGARGGGPTR